MKNKKSFGIIGGDMRQYHLAKSLLKDGHNAMIFGFDKIEKKIDNFKKLSISEILNLSDYIILPVPITRDNININAPFSKNKIAMEKQFLCSLKNKKVFGGIIISPIENHVKKGDFLFYDYYNENFIMENAYLTAKGAVKILLKNSLKSINNSKCLVLGYGRIGKYLCENLQKLGANVAATARKNEDKLLIIGNNYNFINTNKLSTYENLKSYDAIFNTIPTTILDNSILKKLSANTIIIDLASSPGGVDKNSAQKLNIKALHELGIPGKYFPEHAGEIIKKTIYKIIEEENI